MRGERDAANRRRSEISESVSKRTVRGLDAEGDADRHARRRAGFFEQAREEIPKLRTMTTCPLAHGEE
jgi:hypothetical protein